MNIELYTNMDKNILEQEEVVYTGDLNITKGLYYQHKNKIYINLGAEQFQEALKIGETYFFEELNKTLVHEIIHLLVEEIGTKSEYNLEGEEKVCQILANQELGFDFV